MRANSYACSFTLASWDSVSFNFLYFAGFFHDLSKTIKNKKKGFEFIVLFANVRWDVIYITWCSIKRLILTDSYSRRTG